MAKSTGNVVNPFFAIDRFGVDAMRYYLAHDGGIAQDSDYGNNFVVERYKKGLQGGLGNLVSRVISRPKFWSVRESVKMASIGTLRKPDGSTKEQIKMLEALPEQVSIKMKQLNPGAALHTIMNTVYEVSRDRRDFKTRAAK
jgi:methionyl-tRNA synthetase